MWPRKKRTKPAPPAPFPRIPGNPSKSLQISTQSRSEPAKPDNHADTSRTHEWRSRPAEQERSISQAVLFGAERQTAGVNRDKHCDRPTRTGKPSVKRPPEPHRRTRASPRPNSEFRIPNPTLAAQPPRAPTPVPALKPARRSLSPAHYSLSCNAECRLFAPARNAAPTDARTPHKKDPPEPTSGQISFIPLRAASAPETRAA